MKKLTGILLLTAMIAGCGSGIGSTVGLNARNTSADPGVTAAVFGDISKLLPGGGLGTLASGYASASELLSLVYFIGEVRMCNSTDATSAFGFNETSGCTEIFRNTSLPGDLGLGMETQTFLDTYYSASNTYDLMSTADLARLNAQSVGAQAGDYNYAIVTWAGPIGIKGSVNVNGTTLKTRTQTSFVSNGTDTYTSVPDMTTSADPELGWVQSANGGTVFKFQNTRHIEGGNSYKLELIFNPTGVLTGCTNNSQGSMRDGTHSLTMPMLPVSMILRKANESIMRESYSLTTASADHTLTVDLYSVSSDPDKSILAAQVDGLSTNTTAECHNTDVRVFEVRTAADGTLSFSTGKNGASEDDIFMTGFKRGGAEAVGNTVTLLSGAQVGGQTSATQASMTLTEFK